MTDKPSSGSMYRAWMAFIDYHPDRFPKFKTYHDWITSNDAECRAFRQGWAARWKCEQDPNYFVDPSEPDEP